MAERKYISVIVPLRLEWEPCYWTTEEVEVGQTVRVPVKEKEYFGVISAVGIAPTIPPARIREIVRVESDLPRISETEIRLWHQIADYYLCSVGEVFKAAWPLGKILSEHVTARKRKAKGKERSSEMPEETLAKAREKLRLTRAQERAEKEILEAFAGGRTALLCGVNGSGKTEIYTSLALRALTEGRNVLYLVPEISLGRRLEARMRAVFGDMLLIFHSKETPERRRAVTAAVRSGGSYIVLGARSAVFLPHHDLGLIIVDEEHDSSYKQDSPAPRYNGRDAALMLAALHGSGDGNAAEGNAGRCSVVLGSATPSLESVYNCLSGKYREVRIDQRYHGAGDSAVELIDTTVERRRRGMRGSFSLKLIDRIRECLAGGGQAILLRTRRGYAPVLQCSECGHILRCPHCNVSLTFHRDIHDVSTGGMAGNAASGMTGKTTVEIAGQDAGRISPGRAVCHHCGYSIEAPTRCPECGGEICALGAGTQKIEEEAAELFPDARIGRLDADVMQSAKAEKEVLGKFAKGETDILVGTQVVTKGLDLENISLVAVLQADSMLGLRDFRADEKALQTLTQFRGRCGRGGRQGLLVIQTAQPDHPVYAGLMNTSENPGDHPAGQDEFRDALLAERREFGYPPYTRLINVFVRHAREDVAESLAARLAFELADFNAEGPVDPPFEMEAGQFVREIRVTLDRDRELAARKREILRRVTVFEMKENCPGAVTIDVDPV